MIQIAYRIRRKDRAAFVSAMQRLSAERRKDGAYAWGLHTHQNGILMTILSLRDGTELYCKDWGSGPAILFSHGWPLSADMWEYQMLALASQGFRTIAFDRRGFGRSSQPWTGYDYDTFADDIAELISTASPHFRRPTSAPTWERSMCPRW